MAFPPNYRQERSNRDKAKHQKALEKQHKREEKNAQRKAPDATAAPDPTPEETKD